MTDIHVTKTFLPPRAEFDSYVDQIWDGPLTNQGPLVRKLENELGKFLDVKNLHFVTNGTIALQIGLRSLGIDQGEVITTPFTYVATTSSILWEGCTPVFVDIDPESLCIDPNKIEAAITPRTKAIMPVHVFGTPCDIDAIDAIAKNHNLKVIYDAAHAFGVTYQDRSILNYGDISICSFHATKLFHTIEGGCLVVHDDDISSDIELMKRFGHDGDNYEMLGINAKASEFQAAKGLANLKFVTSNIAKRKAISNHYSSYLSNTAVDCVATWPQAIPNSSYYPVILPNEDIILRCIEALSESNIFPRRYFHPSLNTLSYIKNSAPCPIAEQISSKIICLPLYPDLETHHVAKIAQVLLESI